LQLLLTEKVVNCTTVTLTVVQTDISAGQLYCKLGA